MHITLKDFQPVNSWKPDTNGPKYKGTNIPMDLIDQSTGRKYLNESKGTVRFKAFLLALATPFVHSVTSLIATAYRVVKLVTFFELWATEEDEKQHDFSERLKVYSKDLLKIALQPIGFLGLELAAIYGVLRPYDGRKMYATLERAQFGLFTIAPCFRPDADRHLFRGNIEERNAF